MSCVSRSHYLTVHDALRKLLGPNAKLAAFIKEKKMFQCDMLVNSARTDPERFYRDGAAAGSSTNSEASASRVGSSSEKVEVPAADCLKKGVGILARDLQELLGLCDIIPHARRVDVVFRDRSVIQLALGADKTNVPFSLEKGEDINQEPDWRRRSRLRISLGFDEELFLAECTRSINVAARVLEKSMYDSCRHSSILNTNPRMAAAFESRGRSWQAVLPPVIYWQAHGYVLDKAYGCRHYQNAAATIEHNFAEYYGVFPMDNPFCPGEDLNTMEEVQWLCNARKTGALLTVCRDAPWQEAAVEIVLGTPRLGGDAVEQPPISKS